MRKMSKFAARDVKRTSSTLFRQVSVEVGESLEDVGRIRLDGGVEITVTAAAKPEWVAALLSALVVRR